MLNAEKEEVKEMARWEAKMVLGEALKPILAELDSLRKQVEKLTPKPKK